LPGTHLQLDFMPPSGRDESHYLREIIEEALHNSGADGFVLISSTIEMQQAFRDSGLPTVIAGGLYPSLEGLPFIDCDQREAGRICAEYLLSRGHRRLLFIN